MSKNYDDDLEESVEFSPEEEETAEDLLALDESEEEVAEDEMSEAEARTVDRTRRRRKKKKKKHTALWLLILIMLAIGGVVGAKFYANSHGMRLRQLLPFDVSFLDDIRIPSLSDIPFLNKYFGEETEAVTIAVETTAEETEASTEMEDVDLVKDGNPLVTDLVNSYFAARLAGDSAALSKILVDGVEVINEQLESEKEFVEGYSDIAAYVTEGMTSGEFAVYISYYQKFANIATAAPGLVPCYVITDSEGNMRLSFYNNWDKKTKAFMNKISGMPSVEMLATDVDANFQAAKEADYDLRVFINALLGETEAADTQTTAAETPAESTAQAETTVQASESADSASGEKIEFKDVDDIQYTTSAVRCRKSPSLEETADYTMLELGTWVHVVGISDKWCKVILRDGKSGYVYREFLSPEKPETTAAGIE